MNFKKRVNGSWTDTPHYIHNTSTDTITTLPADIYVNDTTATVGLKGNMSQSSQPSPTTPIQPSECGERTGNLFDELYPNISATAQYKSIYVGDGEYTLSSTVARQGSAAVLFLLAGSTTSGISSDTNGVWDGQSRTVMAINGYITIAYRAYTEVSPTNSQTMLNTGSTALPYEPYGYFIEIEVS